MYINEPDPRTHQPVFFDKIEKLSQIYWLSNREALKQRKDFTPVLDVATC